MTGVCDNLPVMTKENLDTLRKLAVETNADWADRLGIAPAAAITCIKPSGTVSQLVDSASGLHPRHSRHYVRTVRGDNKDPLTAFLKDQGIYHEPDLRAKESTTVFYFPIKAPDDAVTREELPAMAALELWKNLQENYCEHKPSCTINVKEDEWMDVGAWVYRNFDILSGISFLPHDGGSYDQAPYQEISEDQYEDWVKITPTEIDWSKLSEYEQEDNTTGSQEFACTGGVCEVVNIGGVSDG